MQLDCDDLFGSDNTLQTIVDAFRKQNAAMVIGSSRMLSTGYNIIRIVQPSVKKRKVL